MTPALRRFARVALSLVLLLVCVVVAAATAPVEGRVASESAQPPLGPPPDHVGDLYRCFYEPILPFRKCEGYPKKDIVQWLKDDPAELAEWLEDLDVKPHTDEYDLVPEIAGPAPRVLIEAIENPEMVSLRDLKRRGLVMARITVKDPDGPRDKRYGIGKPKDTSLKLGPRFYLVIRPFKEHGENAEAKQVSTWRVLAIDNSKGTARAVELPYQAGVTGKFNFCKRRHADTLRQKGAAFSSCTEAHRIMQVEGQLQDVLGNTTLYGAVIAGVRVARQQPAAEFLGVFWSATPLLRQINAREDKAAEKAFIAEWARKLRDPIDAPAWGVCGLGCCASDS
jgi:hypothetical protein